MSTNESISQETQINLAHWLSKPLTPGREKELTDWLAEDPDNQYKWSRWIEFGEAARKLQIVPTEASAQWEVIKVEMGFGHSSKTRSGRKTRSRRKSAMKSPMVVATGSTVIFGLFLLVLYLLRQTIGF